MPGWAALFCGAACLVSTSAHALELAFPVPAEVTASSRQIAASQRLPIGPFAQGTLPTQLVEGDVSLQAFRLALENASTLDLMRALRDQIAEAGYEVLFECETEACGGFDFRYGMEVLPEPDMHVNLGDFRYILARKDRSHLALMVSRTGANGFVQLTQVGADAVPAEPVAAPVALQPDTPEPSPDAADKGLIAALQAGQAVVLEDLVFTSGSAELAAGDYASLDILAEWLSADATRQIVLVGHTDASGGLEGNIKLSKLRAEGVRQVILYSKIVRPEQILAEGVGPLSPRFSNLTEEGRLKNRRVEAMMTSTELLAP